MEDARIAVETGVDGLYVLSPFSHRPVRFSCSLTIVRDVVIGTSHVLREYSHGKSMEYITKSAIEVINFIKSKGLEVRFSSEDSFRSDLVDLLSLYRTVDQVGVNRVGIADTVGCASPRQVYDLVRTLRGVVCKSGSYLCSRWGTDNVQHAISRFTCMTIPDVPLRTPTARSRPAQRISTHRCWALAREMALRYVHQGGL